VNLHQSRPDPTRAIAIGIAMTLWVVIGSASVAVAADLLSPSFRLRSGNLNAGASANISSTASNPTVGRAGATVSEAVASGLSSEPGGAFALMGFWETIRAAVNAESFWSFFGNADGGFQIGLTISGGGGGAADVMISITTSAGQTGSEIAAAIAVAVNSDPTLQSIGTTAVAVGNRLIVNARITERVIDDPGITGVVGPPPVPALHGLGIVALMLLVGATGWLRTRTGVRSPAWAVNATNR
jgi:hypothetical protein